MGQTREGAPLQATVVVRGLGVARVPPHTSILLRTHALGWVFVEARGLLVDDGCWSDGVRTVVAERGLEARIPEFVEALLAADGAATRIFGEEGANVLIHLGGVPGSDPSVVVPAARLDDVPGAAAWVIAEERLRGTKYADDPALQAALVRQLGGGHVSTGVDPSAHPVDPASAAWTEAAEMCGGGWAAVQTDACVPTVVLERAERARRISLPDRGEQDGPGAEPAGQPALAARWTVVASPDQAWARVPFEDALRRVDTRADGLLDPPRGPLRIALGERRAGFTSIPSGWLEGDLEYVAAYAIAAARLDDAPLTDELPGEVGLYEALARDLVPRPPDAWLAAMGAEDVDPWTRAVRACAGGWRAFARGMCARP